MSTLDLWRGNRSLSPFRGDAFKLADRMWEDFAQWPSPAVMGRELAQNSPLGEVDETKTHYNFKFDMPGLKKEDIKIEVSNNRLIVSGERKQERKEEDGKSYFSEVSYGSYSRSFNLPSTVNKDKIEAKYDNGVLSVSVPKTDNPEVKKISVK